MSGKTLKYDWYQITDEEFYNKDNFFIGALAHCYPGKDKSGNDKQPPKCCWTKWIEKEHIWNGKKTIVLPHPSPLNKKWIKDHPQFLEKRIHEIRNLIKRIIK